MKKDTENHDGLKDRIIKDNIISIEERIKKVRASIECWRTQRELLRHTMTPHPMYDIEFELTAKKTLEESYSKIMDIGIDLLTMLEKKLGEYNETK